MSNTSDSAIPYVISVSYGDDEDSLDKAYTDRINNEFQKLGTRGVSIFFASGGDIFVLILCENYNRKMCFFVDIGR